MLRSLPNALVDGLAAGHLVPYLGPGMLGLCDAPVPPVDPQALAAVLTARVSVPGKIRGRLTAAAQFIENFKHRKTLVAAMNDAYAVPAQPSPLHHWLARLRSPLIVAAWYDDTMRTALAGRHDWCEVQGLSQSEHFGTWTGWYGADGVTLPDAVDAPTVLYKPWGGRAPAGNYLVSDSDFVEVLTELDIQTPIPAEVQRRRASLGFVFLGCRFNDQLPRAFARQILKRSAGPRYAVLPEPPTRMEARFLEEAGIVRVAMGLEEVARVVTAATPSSTSSSDGGLPNTIPTIA